MKSKSKSEHKIHYAWLVLLACCAFFGADVGIFTNCEGVFYQPMCEELGWQLSYLNISTVFSGIASIISSRFVTRIFKRYKIKKVVAFMSVLMGIGFGMKSFGHTLFTMCAAATLFGIGAGILAYSAVPFVINRWFAKRQGLALGTAYVSSGAFSAIGSKLIADLITTNGWRMTRLIIAGAGILLMLPFVLAFMCLPEDVGITAYGRGTFDAEIDSDDKTTALNISAKEKNRRGMICCVLAVTMMMMAGFSTFHVSNFAVSAGLSTGMITAIMPLSMIGNSMSKAIVGPAMDVFGKKKTFIVTTILIVLGVLMLLLGKAEVWIGVGTVCAAFSIALNMLANPALIPTFASGDDHTKYVSNTSTATLFTLAFGNYLISLMYDMFDSYTPVLWMVIALAIISLALILYILKLADKDKIH